VSLIGSSLKKSSNGLVVGKFAIFNNQLIRA
jgi:hypothetical protein